MTSKLNRCWFDAASAGTGNFVYDQTVADYLSPGGAGAQDGSVYAYIAENLPGQWEIGYGAYTSATTTLARTTIIASSNGNMAVDFSDPPNVRMGVALATDVGPAIQGTDGENGEDVAIESGSGTLNGGSLLFTTGNGASGAGGNCIFQGGSGGDGNGGRTAFTGGSGTLSGGNNEFAPGEGGVDGGDFIVTLPGAGSGRQGLARINNLPTADPAIDGALWNDAGTLKVSAG